MIIGTAPGAELEITMTRADIFKDLNEVFQDVFDDATLEVEEETTAADIDGWDSFAHITLIVSVEKKFGVKFSMGQVSSMKNVGTMASILLEKLA